MRVRSSPATLLLRLPLEQDAHQQAAIFRQAMAGMEQATFGLGPPPLDGVDPVALEAATHIALERGYIDQIQSLDAGRGAVALYELSSALPAGSVKRELRRRVFDRLYKGDASTFCAVASRIALGAAHPLLTPTLRARVVLCLELPIDTNVNVAPLALALTTRSATHHDWIELPSTGALTSRRMAALLYEHAAREAVFRFQLGDPQPRDLLLSARWGTALGRLLADREPLVWQHAASARGLLAAISPELKQEVEQSLDPALGVTEWRRAAVSLVASVALGDEETQRSVSSVLHGPLVEQDRGLPAAMVSGLARVIEMEPELAEEIIDEVAEFRRVDIALSVGELLSRLKDRSLATRPRMILHHTLVEHGKTQSKIERSLVSRGLQALSLEDEHEASLPSTVERALLHFEEVGAAEAYQQALGALNEAHGLAEFIETNPPTDVPALAPAIAGLSEVDRGALESATLHNLLLLGRAPGDSGQTVEAYERLQNRVSRWILDGVERAGELEWSRDIALSDQRRLLVLLHLVDVEAGTSSEAEQKETYNRLKRSVRILLKRLADDPDALVHRVLCAALARSFDAAAREGVVQASDLLLVVASTLSDSYSVQVISEASTTPDVTDPLSALADFMGMDSVEDPDPESSSTGLTLHPHSSRAETTTDSLQRIARLRALSRGLIGGGGYHAEALRRVFFRLGRALERIAVARSQAELVQARDTGAPVLEDLTTACEDLSLMIRNSERRVLGAERSRSPTGEEAGLYEVVERGMESSRPPASDELGPVVDEMILGLPECIARVVEQVVFRIEHLPLTSDDQNESYSAPLSTRRAALPNWLLPRRAIGSFHVVRPLGAGGVSSVFIARRLEERNNPSADAFALKVPEYDPSTARSMSEQEFFQMFRDEAGALLSLPSHENLARFVTFDLSARPKPILVMELIPGTPLDRLIRSRALTMPRVIAQLDGILAGLEAMHAVEVGHLDVKPSNVILRKGNTPVLVDFGLSGRTLRPGCGTIEYTAPEVLGVVAEGAKPTPMQADIYAFGCMAYEILTGEVLFQAPDEIAMVTSHVTHDGWIEPLQTMATLPGLDRLANLVGSCLRHDPRNRPTATQLRNALTAALLPLSEQPWPLSTQTARTAAPG